MNTYADDIAFVFSEVARIAQLGTRAAFESHSLEFLAMLPHPSGNGQIFCGLAAHRRLQQTAKIALSRSDFAGRIDSDAVFKELKSIIVYRFMREKRELSSVQADRAVSAAIRAAAKARCDLTHYVPCHIGHADSPESFSVGPVKFSRYNATFERLDSALQSYLNRDPVSASKATQPEERASIADMLLTDARKYYGSFGWVAEVTVPGCDRHTSRQRAERIVQGALDCLHLLIGAAYSNHMRAGGPDFRTDRRSWIAVDRDGVAELSGSIDWQSHNLTDTWWEMMNSDGGDGLISLMGIAIESGNRLPVPAPLAQRFLDGVTWYGEAVRDEFEASRLVKYVTAIERILTTKKGDQVVEMLANRGAALILDPRTDDLEKLRQRFREVYDLRSRMVHGSRSPLDAALGHGLIEAEDLARSVLFRAVQFFGREGLEKQKVNEKNLDEAYSKVLAWADRHQSR